MRVAIVGDGFIGTALAKRLLAGVPGLELCALLSRSGRAQAIATDCTVRSMPALLASEPGLVVEAAHPEVSARWGAEILACCDYLPLSLTALADASLYETLMHAAQRAATRLLIAHGAVVGQDALLASRGQWSRVGIRFRKHPDHIDFTASGVAPAAFDAAKPVFAGSVREIARRFPRNVNAMVACALATTGLDDCHAELYADPSLEHAVLEIDAEGRDGSRLSIRREQPMRGVSGSEMAASTWRSIEIAAGLAGPLAFV